MATSYKPQASSPKLIQMIDTSVKLQAQRFKLQAPSDKLHDLCSLIKFHGPRTTVLDHDETIFRMQFMKGNLMWTQTNRITTSYF